MALPPPSPDDQDPAVVFGARDLTKDYDEGRVKALRGVSFTIREGEFVAIVGPSGCGKTTLLQMLGAMDSPNGGSLHYRGQDLAALPDPARYRAREIGFIFQAFHLLSPFTAIENVQLPMFEGELRSAGRRQRAGELLEAVGLGGRLHHFPAKLSGGERQRVAIARSLANAPSVLLADEPTGNLDSVNSAAIMELIARIQKERNMTLLLVTHDQAIARQASRVIRLRDGQVLFDGAPDALPVLN